MKKVLCLATVLAITACGGASEDPLVGHWRAVRCEGKGFCSFIVKKQDNPLDGYTVDFDEGETSLGVRSATVIKVDDAHYNLHIKETSTPLLLIDGRLYNAAKAEFVKDVKEE